MSDQPNDGPRPGSGGEGQDTETNEEKIAMPMQGYKSP
jgi:hypothetical protein